MSAVVLTLLCFAAGCQPTEVPQPKVEVTLQSLAVLYGQYTGQHQGKAPPDAEEFKKFISEQGPERLAALKVTNVDDLFVSPRDHQPYVVIYNVEMGAPSPSGAPLVAYEQTGVNGKHYVAYATGQMEEVDSAKLQELIK